MAELTHTQKLRVEDWLRHADQLIREGRYIAADEILQKVFQSDAGNDIAHSYEDRIQFLIKQLSQRVGLNNDIQGEIRKYRTIHLQRRTNRIQSMLIGAQRFLDDGYLKKAAELAAKALVVDPENAYARAFSQRVTELQREAGVHEGSESDLKFRALLIEAWRDGSPTEGQDAVLARMQKELLVGAQRRQELEREAKNHLYKERLHSIWLTGGISAFTPGVAEDLRDRFGINRHDYTAIEAAVLREVRKNRIKGTVLIVDEGERSLLDMTTTLRTNGYAVIAAGSFGEVLGTVREFTPDVILCELFVGKEPVGLDVYELIRKTGVTRHAPFYFLADRVDRSTEIIARRLGVSGFFLKPIDNEMLLATISGRIDYVRILKAAATAP